MRIEHLEYLLEVARCKSISAAAKRLYLSQTSLSGIINALEKELNVKLFQRTHRGVVLSPEGEEVVALARDIVEKSDRMQQIFSASRNMRRIVNLVLYPSVSGCLSVELTRRMSGQCADVALQIHEAPYNRIFSSISEGVAKIAVGAESTNSFDPQYEMHNTGFAIETLYEDAFYALLSAQHPYARRQQVDVSELLGERIAITHCYPSSQDANVGQALRRFPHFSVFSNGETAKRAVAEGAAIAIMPGLALLGDPYEAAGLIRRVPITGFTTGLTNYLLFDKQSGLSAAEHILLEEIRGFYQGLDTSAT